MNRKDADWFRRELDRMTLDLYHFTMSYLEAAFWTEAETVGDFDVMSLSRNSAESAILDCRAFWRDNADDLRDADAEDAGHDFWLTRNRHGAGFWDGDWPEPAASRLTRAAKAFGEVNVEKYRGVVHFHHML